MGMRLVLAVQAAWLDHRGTIDATAADLQASLDALTKQGPAFIEELRRAGWEVEKVTIRAGQVRFARHSSSDLASLT
jgi:hypothetical protein